MRHTKLKAISNIKCWMLSTGPGLFNVFSYWSELIEFLEQEHEVQRYTTPEDLNEINEKDVDNELGT